MWMGHSCMGHRVKKEKLSFIDDFMIREDFEGCEFM